MTPSNEDLHFYQREIRPEERSSLSVLAGMVPPGSQVLDLGCGSGALGLHLSATRGCTRIWLKAPSKTALHATTPPLPCASVTDAPLTVVSLRASETPMRITGV